MFKTYKLVIRVENIGSFQIEAKRGYYSYISYTVN